MLCEKHDYSVCKISASPLIGTIVRVITLKSQFNADEILFFYLFEYLGKT